MQLRIVNDQEGWFRRVAKVDAGRRTAGLGATAVALNQGRSLLES